MGVLPPLTYNSGRESISFGFGDHDDVNLETIKDLAMIIIFLFSHLDHDVVSPHFVDLNKTETERRNVDASNSLNDTAPEFKNIQLELDRIHAGEGFYNQWNS